MKVRLTISVNEDARRGIADRVGDDRPATHADIKSWAENELSAIIEDVAYEWRNRHDEELLEDARG